MKRRLDETARHAVANILMEAIDEIARAGRPYSGGMSMAEAAHYWAQAVFNTMQGRNGANSGYQSKGFVSFKGPKSKREELFSVMDWHWTLYSEFRNNFRFILGNMYNWSGQQIAKMSRHTKAQKAKIAKLGPEGTVDIPQSMYKPSKYLPFSREAMRDILGFFFAPKEYEGLEYNAIRIVKAYIDRHKENVPGFDENNPDFNGDEVLRQILSSLQKFVYHTIEGDEELRMSNASKNIRLDQTTNGKGEDNYTGRDIVNSKLKSIGGDNGNDVFKGRDDDAMNPETTLPYSEEELNNLGFKAETVDDLGNSDAVGSKSGDMDEGPMYFIKKLKEMFDFVAKGDSGILSGFYETTPEASGPIFKHFLINAAKYISEHFYDILTPERLKEIRAIGSDKNMTKNSYQVLKDKFSAWCEDAIRDECYMAIDKDELDNDILKIFPGELKSLMKAYGTPEYPAKKEETKKKIGEKMARHMSVFWNNLNPKQKRIVVNGEKKGLARPQRIGQEAVRVVMHGEEPTFTGKFDKKQADKYLENNPQAHRNLDPAVDTGKKTKKDPKVSEALVRSIRSAVREAVRRQLRHTL